MQCAFRIEKSFKYIPKVKVNNESIYTPRFWLSTREMRESCSENTGKSENFLSLQEARPHH
jgi:hypothetical protein